LELSKVGAPLANHRPIGRTTNEGTPMAFEIFSAGPVTYSHLRTVDALPLAAGVAVLLLLLMVAVSRWAMARHTSASRSVHLTSQRSGSIWNAPRAGP
jgi:hypothetical protein